MAAAKPPGLRDAHAAQQAGQQAGVEASPAPVVSTTGPGRRPPGHFDVLARRGAEQRALAAQLHAQQARAPQPRNVSMIRRGSCSPV